MSPLFSPRQRAHYEKAQAQFFSPEAIAARQDPDIARFADAAMIDHLLSGYKNLEPRYNDKGQELPGYNLGVDDPVLMDKSERIAQEIAETKNALLNGETREGFETLSPQAKQMFLDAINKELFGGAIDKIGELGTKQRVYPKNFADPALAGKKIPAVFEKGQKRERGRRLLLDSAELVDRDTGAGLYGFPRDALHREAAANNPALLTDIGNIRMGGSSLNQSIKEFEGEQLKSALKSRLSRLRDEQFLEENGIPATQRGGIDKRTNAENLAYMQLMNKIDDIIKTVGPKELRAYDNQVRQNGGDDRQVTINADTVILEKAINGNGRRRR